MAHRGLAWLPDPRPLDGALEELPPDAWRVLQVESGSGSGELEPQQSALPARASLPVQLALPLVQRWQVPGRQLGLLLPPVWLKSQQQRAALRAWPR